MATEKRLIDVKGKFVLNAGDLTGHIMCFENGYATVFDRLAKVVCKFSILDAPTVDAVEVVHGRWIEKPYLFGTTRYCSICGQNYGMPHGVFNYCPNCGAKMDGDGNGQ